MFNEMLAMSNNGGSDEILKATAGDTVPFALYTGANITTAAGKTGKKFKQIVYDVTNVNSVTIYYSSAWTGNRGSSGVEIDGVYDTLVADGAQNTAGQNKTYSLSGKKILSLYGNEDNGTDNWGGFTGGKMTFS